MGGRFVQRSALALCSLIPAYRSTRSWLNNVWQADQQQYRRLVVARLNLLLTSLARRGLLHLDGRLSLPLSSLERLRDLPSLTRAGLREMFPRLDQLYGGDRRYALYRTGGTTGQPTRLYRPKSNSAGELASAQHMLQVVGWRPGMLRVALWGSQRDLNLGIGPGKSVKRSINAALQQVRFFDSYKSDEAIYMSFIDCVLSNRGCAIYGYPTMMAECARLLRAKSIQVPQGQVAAIWTTSEMLHPSLAAEIQQAYKVQPRDFYGTRECPSISAECEHGRKHINPRYIVETLSETEDRVLGDGEVGELALTDLLNPLTPLVRYRVGDRGRASWTACACGRRGLVLEAFEGRTADSYVLKSGLRRTAIWFTDIVRYPEVSGAQLVRTGLDSFEVRYTGSPLPEESVRRIKEVARYMLEGAEVGVRLVERIPRSPEGKVLVYLDESAGQQEKPPAADRLSLHEVIEPSRAGNEKQLLPR